MWLGRLLIKNSMVTKEEIIRQLNMLGVPQDKPVIVHTSLKAIGEVAGRAQGLLDALIEHVTAKGGLLIVPTHTWANFYEKRNPVLDMTSNYACIGVFSSVAAADNRGVRTLNPTHSLCVFGESEKVKEFVDTELFVDTPTSHHGSYGKIMDEGAVLLIGVGQEKNTLLHCVEEFLGIKNRLSKTAVPMQIKKKDGEIIEKDFYYMISDEIEDVSVFFPKYEKAFRYFKCIKDGMVGNAKTQLCDARAMKDVMTLIHDRSGGVELLSNDKPLDEKLYK